MGGEAFMRCLWVKYGDKETIIDMEDLITANDKDFATTPTNEFVAFAHFDCDGAKSIKVAIVEGLSLIVSTYPDPQIKTGFSIIGNTEGIEEGTVRYPQIT